MAITGTSLATETIYAKILTNAMIDAMYSVAVMDDLVRQESLVGQPSLTYSFPVWPSLTAAAGPGETTDLTTVTSVDTTNVDIAVTEGSVIRIDITDLLEESTIVSGGMAFAAQGAKAVADKRDADLAALLSAFSTVVGTTGVDLTEGNLLDAFTVLARTDAPRPYVGVLHPQQIGDLRRALSTTTAVVQSNTSPESLGVKGNGLEFPYYGVPLFATTNVPDMAAAADHGGAIFALRQALARVDKRAIRLETQRDASARSTEFIITSVYGQGELVDGWGVTVQTDHS
jgi:hypothetical protein